MDEIIDNKKILILGATGAMAVYLIPELLDRGCSVVGVSLDDVVSQREGLTYIKADAKNPDFLKEQLEKKYDAVVDFMIYNSVEMFEQYYKLFLENTKHYIYFSTYRVYADDSPLNEKSKRLWDIDRPDDFVTEYEYSIYKAREEDLLRSSKYDNYTIVRPAVTYSKRRFQLTVLEANVLIYRMLKSKTVVLPSSAMDKQATMSWAGDVAKMLAGIILNPKAFKETYNISTSEHMTWREVAEIYREIGNLKYITVDDDTFLDIIANGDVYAKQQLLYDRCFDRIVDNKKILSLINMHQEDLTPLKDGLTREFKNITIDDVGCNTFINERMDKYLENID
ncbi:MAG: NAD-dependent epimerase/dehydratase family protein [Clostridia bacterium]|nr:NAD-dependent epimerase/dehydratase family protein [Clostridia bacterium]